MSLYIGNQKLGSLYLGSTKIKEAWVGNVKVYGSGDPYNPLNLPPFTIRCKFSSGYTPSSVGDSQTLVDPVENVWDITQNSTEWHQLLGWNNNLLGVLGANSTGVTSMVEMFRSCRSLTSVPLFDTRSCTDMHGMFDRCTSLTSVALFDTSSCTDMMYMFFVCYSLTSVPLFDTSSCRNMVGMFSSCTNVESGALALYQQASSQSNPPTYHDDCFTNCGSNTVTETAELQLIPESWGGLAPG